MSQQPLQHPQQHNSSKLTHIIIPIIVALIGAAALIIAAKIQSGGNQHDLPPVPTTLVTLSPTPPPTPNRQATVIAQNAQATRTAEAHAQATATADAQSRPTPPPSTPQQTLQTLCTATVRADYQTQWNQFDYTYATGNWDNESMYASDLKNRDASHNGVANCTVTNVTQNGSSASGTTTTTFGDGTTDKILFSLTKEGDGVWRITGLQHE